MTFASRLILVSVLAVFAAVTVAAVAAYEVRVRINEAIDQTRVAHLLGTLQATGQANLDIGLSLDQIGLLQARIEREKAGDPAILAIDVYDINGRVLYSTDRGSLGEPIAEGWITRLDSPSIWHIDDKGDHIFGIRLENDLGKPIGGIALTVPDPRRSDRSLEWGAIIAAYAVVVAAVAAGLAAITAFLYARWLTRPFAHASLLLAEAPPDAAPRLRFDAAALDARRAWVQADAAINAGLERLGALDDVH